MQTMLVFRNPYIKNIIGYRHLHNTLILVVTVVDANYSSVLKQNVLFLSVTTYDPEFWCFEKLIIKWRNVDRF